MNDEEDVAELNDPGLNLIAMTATEAQFLEWMANVIIVDDDPETKLMAIAMAVYMRSKYVR